MEKPKLHLICNAHLDPVWQWRWEEGCSEALSTFACAVDILHEHPSLVFNHNEAVLYEWVERYDPSLFKEIQRLVAQKRWHISGGWYLQPDVNLPGIESIIRQIQLGRRFFKSRFNAEPVVAYNFDSFGHSAGLPQVLRKAGYRMYIHMRPQEADLALPSDLYMWKGADGSEILTYRIAVGLYHTERDNILSRLEEGTERALRLKRDVPVFWGIGNHGGGPTREDLETIDAFMKKERRVRIIHSTPEALFRSLRSFASRASVVEGDLQRVFTGCYTSCARIKRASVASLGTIVQTEAASALAWWMKKSPYPAAELDAAWRDHCFNDFHDILPGSCTEPAEADALALYARAETSARALRLKSVAAFNAGAHARFYIPVTVLNTNPSCTHVPLEAECMLDLRPKWSGMWHLRLYDMEGRELPSQEEQPESLLPFNGWRRKLAFMAHVPALGLARYEIRIHEGAPEASLPWNAALDHEFDERTQLVGSIRTKDGTECLKGGLMPGLVVEDSGDAWGAECWSYRNVVGCFMPQHEASSLLAEGAVRKIREMVFTYGRSRMIVRTISYRDLPLLEYRIRLEWNERRMRLKLAVPCALDNAELLCEVPGGAVVRPPDGQEHVHGRWCMISDGRHALGIAGSGQHGLDWRDGELRLSVLRSAAYCHEKGFMIDGNVERNYMDQGIHEFRLVVTAGEAEEVMARIPGLALWLAAPPAVYAHLPIGETHRQSREEFCRIAPSTIRLLALKQSEDARALILRLEEASGKTTLADITLGGVKKRLRFDPFEIRTLRFERAGTAAECRMITEC
ncbi:MAG: glycoside hydrolase family 38 C-terminal domain-containing protein [Acidobacteriota bacterium]